jgi:hypothetical protein
MPWCLNKYDPHLGRVPEEEIPPGYVCPTCVNWRQDFYDFDKLPLEEKRKSIKKSREELTKRRRGV